MYYTGTCKKRKEKNDLFFKNLHFCGVNSSRSFLGGFQIQKRLEIKRRKCHFNYHYPFIIIMSFPGKVHEMYLYLLEQSFNGTSLVLKVQSCTFKGL